MSKSQNKSLKSVHASQDDHLSIHRFSFTQRRAFCNIHFDDLQNVVALAMLVQRFNFQMALGAPEVSCVFFPTCIICCLAGTFRTEILLGTCCCDTS